jgi:molybdenum cofactor synthesis domain-containing protein
VKAEVIAVGSELLLGQIGDTNSAVIARHLAAIGLDLFYKTTVVKATVVENLGRLTGALRQALDRSDDVITTGGIGPTADDVTREAVAAATDRELVFSDDLMRQIETFFAARGMQASPSNRRQAQIPTGAIPVENPVGTAPAFIVESASTTVITLSGVLLAVWTDGQREAREHRFGGDAASIRIRAAALLLDPIRRALPAEAR